MRSATRVHAGIHQFALPSRHISAGTSRADHGCVEDDPGREADCDSLPSKPGLEETCQVFFWMFGGHRHAAVVAGFHARRGALTATRPPHIRLRQLGALRLPLAFFNTGAKALIVSVWGAQQACAHTLHQSHRLYDRC
jgi:hypothetical protein